MTLTEQEKKEKIEYKKYLDSTAAIHYSVGSDIFKNVDGNNSVRDGFSRRDYSYFRPDETSPTKPKDIIKACRNAYRRIGLVNNIVNLMSDFTTQGAYLVHPNSRIQKFYTEWWNKVNGTEVSGKFSKNIYRDGMVSIQRTVAKLKAKDVDNLQKGYTTAEADVEPEQPLKISKNEIPWKYTFLNPISLTPIAGDLAIFSGGDVRYGIEIPPHLAARIKNPQNIEDKTVVSTMPSDIVNLIRNGIKTIPLDPLKVSIFFYKKDDWEQWADPMLYCVMDDLILLNKLKLADLAALDGAISHIRIWKLGSLEPKVAPNPDAMRKLADTLLNNVGGGSVDLVWGPDLELKETSTEIYKFLGGEKYGPTLNSIYAGLGIPPTLTGAATASGFTNNYISLQTLLERLNYVRMLLTEFWEREIKIVQRAMGFRQPAQIQFDRMTLTDEGAEKNLLINMYDRGLISDETILDRFGEVPELEAIRTRRDERMRQNGRKQRKAGPYHTAEHKENLEKIFAQTGTVVPSQLGVELKEKKKGEKTALDMRQAPSLAQNGKTPAKKGVSGEGRPISSNDKTKRKKKRVLPRGAKAEKKLLSSMATLKKNQKTISEYIDPVYLSTVGKKNIRSLSNEEFDNLEDFKFAVLANIGSLESMNEEMILQVVNTQNLCIPNHIHALYKETVASYVSKFEKHPTIEDLRSFQVSICAFDKYEGE